MSERVGTDRWYELRAAAIARAGGICERCTRPPGPDASLCLKLMRRDVPAGTETLEDVAALCVQCLHRAPRRPLAFRRPR